MNDIDWLFHLTWITPLLVFKLIATVGYFAGFLDEIEDGSTDDVAKKLN